MRVVGDVVKVELIPVNRFEEVFGEAKYVLSWISREASPFHEQSSWLSTWRRDHGLRVKVWDVWNYAQGDSQVRSPSVVGMRRAAEAYNVLRCRQQRLVA